MKVISGFLKGRIINGYNIDGTRPTMDRVKESIFAIIQDSISNSLVLDLFSGSGNSGIEVIKNNLKNFNTEDKAIIYNYDYKKCLNVLKDENIKFDIIFLDPPYKLHIINEILRFIDVNDLLNQNGIVVCEYYKDVLLDNYFNLKKIKERKYGEKEVSIYRKG